MIRLKRVYEPPERTDGVRFLVDGLWPRGVAKAGLRMERWVKEVAPGEELRKWFGHEPAKWSEFQRRYAAELESRPEAWQPLLEAALRGPVTLLFGARDTEHNNAVALKAFLQARLPGRKSPAKGDVRVRLKKRGVKVRAAARAAGVRPASSR